MTKRIKSLIVFFTLLAMAVLAGCGSSTTKEAPKAPAETKGTAARSVDQIKKSGEVIIGVFSDKAPFGYVDSTGNIRVMMFISQNVSPKIWALKPNMFPWIQPIELNT